MDKFCIYYLEKTHSWNIIGTKLFFIRNMDNTITGNLTDIFQSLATNAEFVSYSLRVSFKIIKVGYFYRWVCISVRIAAELSVRMSVNKMMTFDLPRLRAAPSCWHLFHYEQSHNCHSCHRFSSSFIIHAFLTEVFSRGLVAARWW